MSATGSQDGLQDGLQLARKTGASRALLGVVSAGLGEGGHRGQHAQVVRGKRPRLSAGSRWQKGVCATAHYTRRQAFTIRDANT